MSEYFVFILWRFLVSISQPVSRKNFGSQSCSLLSRNIEYNHNFKIYIFSFFLNNLIITLLTLFHAFIWHLCLLLTPAVTTHGRWHNLDRSSKSLRNLLWDIFVLCFCKITVIIFFSVFIFLQSQLEKCGLPGQANDLAYLRFDICFKFFCLNGAYDYFHYSCSNST